MSEKNLPRVFIPTDGSGIGPAPLRMSPYFRIVFQLQSLPVAVHNTSHRGNVIYLPAGPLV